MRQEEVREAVIPSISKVGWHEVAARRGHASYEAVQLLDAQHFTPGNIHDPSRRAMWEVVLETFDKREEVLRWLEEGVRPSDYFEHFTGTWEGVALDSQSPLPFEGSNHIKDELVGPEKLLSAQDWVRAEIGKMVSSNVRYLLSRRRSVAPRESCTLWAWNRLSHGCGRTRDI